jgi:hypothetical protein
VIFQENSSFDHYFGAYPIATARPSPKSGVLTVESNASGLLGFYPFVELFPQELPVDDGCHSSDLQGIMHCHVAIGAEIEGSTDPARQDAREVVPTARSPPTGDLEVLSF